MESKEEKKFDKYTTRGNQNWREMMSRDVRVFNAYQQARYEWIVRIAGDVQGKKVLDVGCGGGSLVYLLAKAGADIAGVESEELGLRFAEGNLASVNRNQNLKYKFAHASAYRLPFGKDSFDVVVSCEVVEHLHEPEQMLGEASRVLKRGGRFVLTTPYRLTEFPQDPNHVKEYVPGEMQGLLEKHFKNVDVKLTHHVLWRALYTHPVRSFGNRPLGKWFLNALVLWFGWNPFMVDYGEPRKNDIFSSILAWGYKQ